MSAELTKTVEWQARVLPDGAWRKVQPTRTETLAQRVDYLRGITRNGQAVYELRELCLRPSLQTVPKAPADPALRAAVRAVFTTHGGQLYVNGHRVSCRDGARLTLLEVILP